MSERMTVADYRKLVGVADLVERKSGGVPQALGRLKSGEKNKTEVRYEIYLDRLKHMGEVLWFAFEPVTFRLAKKTSLTPDFMVMRASGAIELHDVKGHRAIYTDDAKAKMKIAASTMPFRFFVCFPRKAKDGGGWDVEEI